MYVCASDNAHYQFQCVSLWLSTFIVMSIKISELVLKKKGQCFKRIKTFRHLSQVSNEQSKLVERSETPNQYQKWYSGNICCFFSLVNTVNI